MNIEQYLRRINFKGETKVSIDCLKLLHRCHVMAVPFEAIDVLLNRNIDLELSSIYNKIIVNQRGGFCYELNYLFHALLQKIGFESWIISSRIFDHEKLGPKYDHMSIIVKLEEDWLVDVGYGDLFIEPLKINSRTIQEDQFKNYKIDQLNKKEFILLESLKSKTQYIKRYSFDLSPRKIEEFYDQCHYKQYAPESYFVNNTICTLPTKTGRKTILNHIFKIKRDGQIQEKTLQDDNELFQTLQEEFNVHL